MTATEPTKTGEETQTDPYKPRKEDKFSFGLWTMGNRGHDGFGEATRRGFKPAYLLEKLAGLGAWGVNFQDDDLVASEAPLAERSRAARQFKQQVEDNGLVTPMGTTALFVKPVFKEGAFTAVDPGVRAFTLQKTLRAIDFAAEVGAPIFNLWGAREGVDAEGSKDPLEALKRYREAIGFICRYVEDQGYNIKFALEPKPNEPRSDSYLPTAGHALAFIATLDQPDRVGVNLELAHETIANLNFYHEVAQALEAGKLFHIDLNDQKVMRYDQNMRFGSESLKIAFFTVKLLEEKNYAGPRHFDVHPYRTEAEADVWDAALGSMRTYKILKEKAQRFAADPRIEAILGQNRRSDLPGDLLTARYSPETARRLKDYRFDPDRLARKGYRYEKLDQLTIEYILGIA
ncbi:MAG: xylose isomerase [Chloroflexi bacterium]|nr:xylose isomerase [Chloroflexota bacterium]OJV92284.1 MAG: xylose isomerase [Chloroflexi bacterium 54-19]